MYNLAQEGFGDDTFSIQPNISGAEWKYCWRTWKDTKIKPLGQERNKTKNLLRKLFPTVQEFHKHFWKDTVQIQIKLLPALTTFCIYADLSVHPKDPGRFKFSRKEGMDCFTSYNKGSRDFCPDYDQTKTLRQL